MHVVIFSEKPALAIATRSAVKEAHWTQESVQTPDELRKALTQSVTAIVTTLPPPKISLAAFTDELIRLNPSPKLYLYVPEEDEKSMHLDQNLGRVDLAFIVTKGEPKKSGGDKIRYCRDMKFGEGLVAEIKSSLTQTHESTTVDPAEEAEPETVSSDATPVPTIKKRQLRRGGTALLERTCPYPHLDVPAAEATLAPETKQKQMFVDKTHPKCHRAIQRCPNCKATNRASARCCRSCGAVLDFAALEAGLYEALSLTEAALNTPRQNVDLTIAYGMKSISRMLATNGFLWLGGAGQDGRPLLAMTCLGETFRSPYRIRTEVEFDSVLGLEALELQERPALLITSMGGVHTLSLLPRPELTENIFVSSPGYEFRHPAVMLSRGIAVLEHSAATDTYYFRAGSIHRELGADVSELVPIDSDRVIVCTPQKLWCYDAQSSELKPTNSRYLIDVFQRPVYRPREQQLYLKTDHGVCLVNVGELPWFLDLRAEAAQPFSFCLNRSGSLIWVHSSQGIFSYSASADARRDFDSRSLSMNFEVAGIEPVEKGGLLFITSRMGTPSRHQVGLINPQRKGDYIRGQQFDRVLLPPQFNMGSGFVAVSEARRLYLREYPLI